MSTLVVAVLSFAGFIVAYHTYGRYLARKIFQLDPEAVAPSVELRDGVDYVPTRRAVVFGHHFTSIAGTGPIVGPAIAVFWGWLPALLWVVFGSIFIGAVHDLGALIVSMRSRGQTIGDVAGRMVSPRARILFLLILFFSLTVVLAVFGLVIATIFKIYPQTVLSVWVAMPAAVAVGFWVYGGRRPLLWPSLFALVVLYGAVYCGVYFWPITLPVGNPVVVWTLVLLVYCFIASVLPVWMLLQPRDYINSHQLFVGLALLMLGLFVVHPPFVAPAVNANPPVDAPPILPFLFITIACGAVSGFHCLVSSGTSSKQLAKETDAHFVGYGAMLLEGALAVMVIIACCAGVGMGIFHSVEGKITPIVDAAGAPLVGAAAFNHYYSGGWEAMKLGDQVGAFVEGGANLMAGIGVPIELAVGVVAVMVACFAATTLDTATRLQRYVVQELGGALRIAPLTNKYAATTVAVVCAGFFAMLRAPGQAPGTGGLILWPLFGATNQLLAGLAFMVVAFYLIRHERPIWFLAPPAALMLVMPAWAMALQIEGWIQNGNWLLVGIGVLIEGLQAWMIIEALVMWNRAKGVLPEPLPPLRATAVEERGRVC